MVALVNLIVRMGVLASTALREWTERVSLLLKNTGAQPFQPGTFDDWSDGGCRLTMCGPRFRENSP